MICCWIFRFSAGRAMDADRLLSPRQLRHRESCVECGRYFETQRDMISRLGEEARVQRPQGPAFLHGKTMARLAADERFVEPRSQTWRTLVPGAFAGAAMIVVLVFLFSPPAVRHSSSEPSATAVSMGPSVPGLRLDFAQASVLLSQPLETEVQALAHDARTAMDLLAQNFLPTPR